MKSVRFSFLSSVALLMLLGGTFSASVFAASLERKAGESTALECSIERDDPDNLGEVVTERIYSFGVPNFDGSLRFNLVRNNIPTFFFRRTTSIPMATWHNQAKINIQAMLKRNELTYSFQFYNYLYKEDQVHLLYMEKRRIDVTGYEHISFEFQNEEARLLDYQSHDEVFVNERGAKLIKCSLRNLDYKRNFLGPVI